MRFQLDVLIPPTRFELVSPDPKSCMIDRYTTGVQGEFVHFTGQISMKKICLIPFRAGANKISIRAENLEVTTERRFMGHVRVYRKCTNRTQRESAGVLMLSGTSR